MLSVLSEIGQEMLSKHRDQQSLEREKLAKHRKKCFSNPEKYMGIVIDGMDQKKTRLPHWPRPPKSIDESCLIQLHVVGCLVFNGELHSRVFLNYPNLHNDGNLTITILQRVIVEWEKRPGGLPPVLYLQLDNTSRENKNNLLMTYLHMLLEKKVFKKIKLGFLLVGHTHDQIDQMFSRFSRRLAKHKAYTFEELCSIISKSYTPEPIITLLTETFDFKRYAFDHPSLTMDQLRNIKFSHQFKIAFDSLDDKVPRQWGKKFSTEKEWLPKEGVKLLKDELPEKIIWSSPGIALFKKGDKKTLDDGKNDRAQQMETSLLEIEKAIKVAFQLFSEDHVKWWVEFFAEQRAYNSKLLLVDIPMSYEWRWASVQIDIVNDVIEEECATLTAADINERVYGPSRDIYVGRYRPQEVIEQEKENMSGDFSDLLKDTFVAVACEETESKGMFWVAKVERILLLDENSIPRTISVLWYNIKRDQDPWKGKYFPEVLGYEKKKSRSKSSTQKTVLHHAELDLSETSIFAYNFYLSKTGSLYKKTIDRIKIRMADYISEKKKEGDKDAGPSNAQIE